MNDDVILCEDCKFFENPDMDGDGYCSVYKAPTWYWCDAVVCPYFKQIKAEED